MRLLKNHIREGIESPDVERPEEFIGKLFGSNGRKGR